ncbi:14339_t:CDS:1, partial [Dentiscutata erythropus]
ITIRHTCTSIVRLSVPNINPLCITKYTRSTCICLGLIMIAASFMEDMRK